MMASMDLGASGVTEEVGPDQSVIIRAPEKTTDLVEYIKERIWQDPLSADLQWCLFLAAMKSYRHDSVLRPFPPMFQAEDQEKDIHTMQELVEDIPHLVRLPREVHKLPAKLLELIKWVLDSKAFTMSNVDLSKLSEIQQLTGHTVKVPTPNYIFEVIPGAAAEEKFDHLRNHRKLLYAYHGSRLENFHSILHNGLASHMNKVSVFGEGTYLSGELSVSLIYSPTGVSWDNSDLGNRLSCVAVCEMIDDPAVKCQDKPATLQKSSSSSSLKSRANAGPSEGGDVPEKYYVVQNNEVIRVKYLLVYAHKTNTHRSVKTQQQSWFVKHKFALLMFAYVVVLCAVGLMNSQTFQNTVRRLWRSR